MGVYFSIASLNKLTSFPFRQNQKVVFKFSMYPNIVFVPLFPSKVGFYSPKIYAPSPCSPKSLGGPQPS